MTFFDEFMKKFGNTKNILGFESHFVMFRSSQGLKKCKFLGSLLKFPVGRKLKTIAPLWCRKRKLFT